MQNVANGAGSAATTSATGPAMSPSPPNPANPVSVTMNQARSITANYVVQYQRRLATNPAAVGTDPRSPAARRQLLRQRRDGDLDRRRRPSPTRPASRYDFRNWTGDVACAAEPGEPGLGDDEPGPLDHGQLRRPVPAPPGDRSGGGGHRAHIIGASDGSWHRLRRDA